MRQLERDFEVADAAYMLLLKNYKIDDATGKINQKQTEIKEMFDRDDQIRAKNIAKNSRSKKSKGKSRRRR